MSAAASNGQPDTIVLIHGPWMTFVLPISTLKSALPALSNPFDSHRAVALTAEQFHYAFTNTLSEEES